MGFTRQATGTPATKYQRLKSLSFEDAQSQCNVDYESVVAFVAATGTREMDTLVGSSCYFVNEATNIAETAFMIDHGWQGIGLGGALQSRMREFAESRGIRGFVSEILAHNEKMIRLAKSAGHNVTIERDGNTVHVTMLFDR